MDESEIQAQALHDERRSELEQLRTELREAKAFQKRYEEAVAAVTEKQIVVDSAAAYLKQKKEDLKGAIAHLNRLLHPEMEAQQMSLTEDMEDAGEDEDDALQDAGDVEDEGDVVYFGTQGVAETEDAPPESVETGREFVVAEGPAPLPFTAPAGGKGRGGRSRR